MPHDLRASSAAKPSAIPKSPVGKVVLASIVFFLAVITWRGYTAVRAKGLSERLKRTDPATITQLAADAKSSGSFAKELEQALNRGGDRRTALAAVVIGATNDEAWATAIVDRELSSGSLAVRLDLAEVLRPSPARSARKDVGLLARLVKDADASVRHSAAGAMMQYGAAGADAVAALVRAGPPNEIVDAIAGSVIKGESTHLSAFKAAAASGEAAVRERALFGLGAVSPTQKPPSYFPMLEKGLNDAAENVSRASARALVRHGPAALRLLEDALNARSKPKRAAAVEGLAEAPALSTRLAPAILRQAVAEEGDLAPKVASLLVAVPPTDDLVKAMRSAANGDAKDRARLRAVIAALVTNPGYPPAREDCGEMGPFLEVLVDLPCDAACLARVRREEAGAVKGHPCWEDAYGPILGQLGAAGPEARRLAALALAADSGGGAKRGKRKGR